MILHEFNVDTRPFS
jgi:exosome complex exonuclease DIS3/RRP44